ncbi:MAG: hypothetical protein AAGL08_20205, partial [Cyanobacteria bacterium J06573_11]
MPRTPASRHTSANLPSARARQEASQSAMPLLSNHRRSDHRRSDHRRSDHRRKVLWAGGAITLLAMATILPTQV